MIKVENADIKLAREMLISCVHTFCCSSADYHIGYLAHKRRAQPFGVPIWQLKHILLFISALPAGGGPGINRV